MLKKLNNKFVFMGIFIGILAYVLPILLLRPDGHIIAYIYDKDILELHKQKKLKLRKNANTDDGIQVDDIKTKESINGMEII